MSDALSAPRREARLLPEFAEFHAELEPGVWVPAADAAERVMEYASTADHLGLYPRALDSRHFEFRGGDQSPDRPAGALTRAYDQ